MHIQLDPVGGIAGDMFVAALLDAFPPLHDAVQRAVRAAGLPERFRCDLVEHADHALTGKRFLVQENARPHSHHHPHHPDESHGPAGHSHGHEHAHPHHHHDDAAAHDHGDPPVREHHHEHAHDIEHGHKPFSAIRAALIASPLDPKVREITIAIFTHLAEAEAQVHGMTADTVTFHEVGEWDSVADIVAAAAIIQALDGVTWSIGPLPLGSGFVRSAHGLLPVPAPATTLLLRGMNVRDDGIPGERVTPTGAAIVRYLASIGGQPPRERTLLGTGLGFGTRVLPGLSNCLRAMVFDNQFSNASSESVTSIEFEIDDQTAEDLAIGLDHLRAHADVLDVIQIPALGKKGRVVVSVRVLCRAGSEQDIADLCFTETTTLGVRLLDVRRRVLAREKNTLSSDGHVVETKTARRPLGVTTTKAEAESLREVRGHHARARLRRATSGE